MKTVFMTSGCAMLLIALCACGPRIPTADLGEGEGEGEGEDAATPEDLPPPYDLPCGGADLMTDNANCGACGNECLVRFEGTDLEAGGCVDGVCTPTWDSCLGEQANCAEACASFGRTCVEGGCAGLSGFMLAVPWFQGCDPMTDELTPVTACDEPLTFSQNDETQDFVTCCCTEP